VIGTGVVGTLRGGATRLVNSVTRPVSALVCESVRGARAVAGDGFWSATTIPPFKQATMVSVEELGGILTLVGYHVKVSQMRLVTIVVLKTSLLI
jgi:hypothetical protein